VVRTEPGEDYGCYANLLGVTAGMVRHRAHALSKAGQLGPRAYRLHLHARRRLEAGEAPALMLGAGLRGDAVERATWLISQLLHAGPLSARELASRGGLDELPGGWMRLLSRLRVWG